MTYKEAVRALSNAGFIEIHKAKGSHHIWQNSAGKRFILAQHTGKELSNGIVCSLKKILRKELTK